MSIVTVGECLIVNSQLLSRVFSQSHIHMRVNIIRIYSQTVVNLHLVIRDGGLKEEARCRYSRLYRDDTVE